MNLLFRLFIFGLLPLLIAKPINPDGKETSVLLENINNKGKNYKYYEREMWISETCESTSDPEINDTP